MKIELEIDIEQFNKEVIEKYVFNRLKKDIDIGDWGNEVVVTKNSSLAITSEKHINSYKHHYRNPEPSLQYMNRNLEFKRLLEILSKVDILEE